MGANPRFYGGKRYRSGFEAKVAQDLIERNVPFEYEGNKYPYEMQTMYVSDFVLPLGVVVECKGYLRPTDRRQLKDVKRTYPDLDIRLLFMNAKQKLNWRSPKSQTYGQWATANGFPWAEGKVPDSWVLAPE